jgi:hypothetical protein
LSQILKFLAATRTRLKMLTEFDGWFRVGGDIEEVDHLVSGMPTFHVGTFPSLIIILRSFWRP